LSCYNYSQHDNQNASAYPYIEDRVIIALLLLLLAAVRLGRWALTAPA
jgi:hypothetical protein